MTQAVSKQFLTKVADEFKENSKKDAERDLARMISPDQYIGDLITLDYGHADILVHDTQRNRANGIPHGCMLLATRITPADLSNKRLPSDPSLLLIRVSESARLRSDADLETARLDAVKRANDTDRTYDESGHTDQFTLNMLRYSGIRCRILGTFRTSPTGTNDEWAVHFGSDISNFNAGQGMKIYKPSGPSLEQIVNRRRVEEGSSSARRVGRLRYSAAVIEADVPEAVPVSIRASDFIAQRTALFGMTRTGKSNTTKTIAKALFELRSEAAGVKVGQLIFDPNGEYANDNPQGVVPFAVELWSGRLPVSSVNITPLQQLPRRAGPARRGRPPGTARRGSLGPAGSAVPPPLARSPPSVESSDRHATA